MYDIIGDIHGHASELRALLGQLGYEPKGKSYRHPEGRQLLFVGDIIDRGTEQNQSVALVRAMLDSGDAQAVMGNHEFNAICFAENGPDGQPIRSHNEDHIKQHEKFLAEFPLGSAA
ncbi:metallophosphoesterase, partial [Arthrospira platensis SPKY1]|nr:metallophosphoesterase [Arthrospira platensis SPKY1]